MSQHSIQPDVGPRLSVLTKLLLGLFLTAIPARGDLLAKFRAVPLKEIESIVFAARGVNPTDGHWYANFGYYSHDPDRKAYVEGAKLYRLNLGTRELTGLLTDATGGVRDPQVSYDGKRIIFSYRPGGTPAANAILTSRTTSRLSTETGLGVTLLGLDEANRSVLGPSLNWLCLGNGCLPLARSRPPFLPPFLLLRCLPCKLPAESDDSSLSLAIRDAVPLACLFPCEL